MSHFGNSHISSFSIIIAVVLVICGQGSLMLLPKLAEDADGGSHFSAIKYFLFKVYTLLF